MTSKEVDIELKCKSLPSDRASNRLQPTKRQAVSDRMRSDRLGMTDSVTYLPTNLRQSLQQRHVKLPATHRLWLL